MIKKLCISNVLASKKGSYWVVGVCAGDMKTTWIEINEAQYNKLAGLPPLSHIDIKMVDFVGGHPVFNIA